MRGSVLINYEEGQQTFGQPIYEIIINNGARRDYQFSEATTQYCNYIYSGDTITTCVRLYGYGETPYINYTLIEYTNDNEGDNGIKTIPITGFTGSSVNGTYCSPSITINPSPNCYDFNVLISAGVTQGCAPIGVLSGVTGTGSTFTTTSEIKIKNIGTLINEVNDIYVGVYSTFTNTRYSGATASSSNIGPVMRLDSTYQLDTNFNSKTALGTDLLVNDIELQNDGRVLVGAGHNFPLITGYSLNRLDTLGNLDGTFTRYIFGNAVGGNESVTDVVQQSDGKIVVSGNFITIGGSTYNRYARFNYDGTIDNTFYSGGTNTGFSQLVNCEIDLQDRLYFFGAGPTPTFNGTPYGCLLRLTPNGQLDTTFNGTGLGGFSLSSGNPSAVNSIKILSDGKILVCGLFDRYFGVPCPRSIVRLNEDGSLDTTFNSGGAGFNYSGATFIATPTETLNEVDDKYLIVFDITATGATYNGQSVPRDIFFLNSDGTLGNNTNLGTGILGSPKTCKLLSNGSYLITGNVVEFNGTPITNGGFIQLSPTGQLQNC
jgi:uncharacterized delta-60 repeat protein